MHLVLPPLASFFLPFCCKADIATAFNTYSRKSGSIAAGEVASALMYAGLFHCPEVYDPEQETTGELAGDLVM